MQEKNPESFIGLMRAGYFPEKL